MTVAVAVAVAVGGGGGGTCAAFSLVRAERMAPTPAAHMAARASSAPVYRRWPGG